MEIASRENAEHYSWGNLYNGWHLLKSSGLSVIQELVPAGGSEVKHFHVHAHQFFFVLNGEATIELNDTRILVGPQQGVSVPPKMPHRLLNERKQELSFLVVSAPMSHGDRVINNYATQEDDQAVDDLLRWAKTHEFIRSTPRRKLVRIITPQEEEQFYTLVSNPEPGLIFHEPVRFKVSVVEARGECRAGHKLGDCWEFDWCTPAGMCGSAYHAMYPVLHGLMLTSGRYEGPTAKETLLSCPDGGWITFRIESFRWEPDDWEDRL
jgi:uncharacterized repeat protein (TIGR04076 family)